MIGVVYLLHSSFQLFVWFRGNRWDVRNQSSIIPRETVPLLYKHFSWDCHFMVQALHLRLSLYCTSTPPAIVPLLYTALLLRLSLYCTSTPPETVPYCTLYKHPSWDCPFIVQHSSWDFPFIVQALLLRLSLYCRTLLLRLSLYCTSTPPEIVSLL